MYEVVKKGKEFHEVHFEEIETLEEALQYASLLWRELAWKERQRASVEVWDSEGYVTLPVGLTLYARKEEATIESNTLVCPAVDNEHNEYIVRWWTRGETNKEEIMFEDPYEVEEIEKRYTAEKEDNILSSVSIEVETL